MHADVATTYLLFALNSGFDYATGDDDYTDFTKQISDAASESGKSVADYYKQSFGQYATEKNVKKYVMEYLKANAYQSKLTEGMTATEAEVREYYDEHKDTYDQVDYRGSKGKKFCKNNSHSGYSAERKIIWKFKNIDADIHNEYGNGNNKVFF